MSATTESQNNTSEYLYHVKSTMIDYPGDKSGATRSTEILGTYVDLAAAKAAASSALFNQGFKEDDFVTYETKNSSGNEEWKFGDGIITFAQTPAGHEFRIGIDTKPNSLGLKGNPEGKVEAILHYGMYMFVFTQLE